MRLTDRPAFVEKILMTYKFEEIQRLRFVVYDADSEGDSSHVRLAFVIYR